jgi:transposase
VIETVREKLTCQNCEKISQPPAPFQVIPRGWAGANVLAMILFEKFGQYQPGARVRPTKQVDEHGACLLRSAQAAL